MWFFYSLISAFVYSLRSIFEKKYILHINKYILAFGVRVFALPFFLIPLLNNPSYIQNLSDLPGSFWIATIYITFISTPIEMLLFYEALKKEEVSTLVPFLALNPIVTTIVNIIVFKDIPTVWGVLGIVLIVAGIYLLNSSKSKGGILGPFKYIAHNPALKLMLIMMLFNSSSIVVDKIGIKGANVYFYAFVNYLLVSLSLFLIAFYKAKSEFSQIKKFLKPLLIVGLIVAIYTLLRFLALDLGNAAYVSAIMGSSTLFTIIWGTFYLKEKEKALKILVGVLITIGLILIKVLG